MLDEGDAFVVAQATREARHGLAQRETRSLSGRDVEAASGGTGVDEAGAVSSIFSGSESSWSLPVTESLNSRIPRPSDLPISGRRLGPKTSRRTRIMTTAPCQPMLPGMGPRIARSGTPGTPRGSRYTGWVTRCAGAPAWNLRKGCNLALLEIRNLRVATEDGTEIVRGVDLGVSPNEVHAIMGPNGSGKSTLAYALMGHPAYEITEGEILLDGENIAEMDADERAQRGLFLAFQYPHAVPGVTVASFLRQAVNSIRKARAGGEDDPVKISDFRKDLTAAMGELKVPKEMAGRYLNEGFSGGEKKRVEILQMAMLKPRVAVLDETDSGLDIDALRIVAAGVKSLVGPEMGALVITHYQRILSYIEPDFVHVFVDGRIVEEGGPELAHNLEAEGYEAFMPEPVGGST